MGDIFCTQCGATIAETDEYCRTCGHHQARAEEIYFPVSPLKFTLMNLVTLNLYLLYWFYRCWRYVKRRESSPIMPFWRTVFMPFWFYALLNDVDLAAMRVRGEERQRGSRIFFNLLLTSIFIVLMLAANWLPDPYWLIAVFNFAPLLPALRDINALNGHAGYHFNRNSRFRPLNFAAILVGLPLLAFLSAGATGLIPPQYVVAGKDLSSRQERMIRDFAGLDPGERIDAFYSAAILFYGDDGNIVTERRLVSYYTADTGERYVETMAFDRIRSVHVLMGGFLDDTVVMACRSPDEFIILYAGTTEKVNHRFLSSIRARLPAGAQFSVDTEETFECRIPSGA